MTQNPLRASGTSVHHGASPRVLPPAHLRRQVDDVPTADDPPPAPSKGNPR